MQDERMDVRVKKFASIATANRPTLANIRLMEHSTYIELLFAEVSLCV